MSEKLSPRLISSIMEPIMATRTTQDIPRLSFGLPVRHHDLFECTEFQDVVRSRLLVNEMDSWSNLNLNSIIWPK